MIQFIYYALCMVPNILFHLHYIDMGPKLNKEKKNRCYSEEAFEKALHDVKDYYIMWYDQIEQGFRREKDGSHGKFIGSNLAILCYKEFGKFALCQSSSQSEIMFIVYSEPVESRHVKINFS